MSKEQRTVEVTPPIYQDTVERLLSKGHVCGYCHGNGWFWGEDERSESTKVPCPVCKGKKRMDAYITIQWCPTKD